jgi:uroporphyrin-III C-methyltransferase
MRATMSRAWLIGAGPGDVELLTLKATRALAQADVVLVDDLVNPEILQFARADAQVVYVGKRGGHPSTPQAGIVAMMLEHVSAGRSVARLKGGDPFVFGRGGEEQQALQEAGIQVEIVNGITAGIAAPAAIGIPVTHRDHAQGVVFVTGHGAGSGEPDWAALVATRMTIVIYMGMRRLNDIVAALLRAGMDRRTPCAAIESATRPEQRHTLAPLGALVETVIQEGLGSPSIVVIGGVASLAMPVSAGLAIVECNNAATKRLSVGIGCKLQTSAEQIEAAVRIALSTHAFDEIRCVATIEAKAHEPGLLEFCARHALPLRAFSRAEVAAMQGVTTPSDAARAHLGVDGVCEPCALLAASSEHLLVPKTVHDGVTVAIATDAPRGTPDTSESNVQDTP